MKTALSLNLCAQRLAGAGVKSPRWDLFLDLVRPERSRGRIGHSYFPTGGHCYGQPLPPTQCMLIGIFPRGQSGSGAATICSAS